MKRGNLLAIIAGMVAMSVHRPEASGVQQSSERQQPVASPISDVPSPHDLVSSGMLAFEKHNWKEAEEFFSASLAATQDKPLNTFFLLARCQLAQRKISLATQTIREIQEREGKSVRCLCLQALAEMLSNNPADAIRIATEAISLRPTHRYAFYIRGIARVSLKKYEEAIIDFEEAEEGTDSDFGVSTASIMLKRAQALEALGRYPQSVGVVSGALELEPSSIEVLVSYWHCQRRDGYLQDALVTAKRALAVSPDDLKANSMASISFAETGNPFSARSCAEKWYEQDPSSQSVMRLLCQLHHACGDSGKAITMIDEVLLEDPENVWARAEKALILATASDGLRDLARAKEIASALPDEGEFSAWCSLVNAICWIDLDVKKAEAYAKKAEQVNASERHKAYLRQIRSRLRVAFVEDTKSGI